MASGHCHSAEEVGIAPVRREETIMLQCNCSTEQARRAWRKEV